MLDLAERLRASGSSAEGLDLGVPMKTADAAAQALSVPVSRIFKWLVVQGGRPEDVAVVVLAGDARLEKEAVARALGWRKASLAPAEVALGRTGYAPGGTPPVAHCEALPVVVDEPFLALGTGYAGGGRPELLRIGGAEIVRLTGALVARVGR